MRIRGHALSADSGLINFMRLGVGIVALYASQGTMVASGPRATALLMPVLTCITRLRCFRPPRSVRCVQTHRGLILSFPGNRFHVF